MVGNFSIHITGAKLTAEMPDGDEVTVFSGVVEMLLSTDSFGTSFYNHNNTHTALHCIITVKLISYIVHRSLKFSSPRPMGGTRCLISASLIVQEILCHQSAGWDATPSAVLSILLLDMSTNWNLANCLLCYD